MNSESDQQENIQIDTAQIDMKIRDSNEYGEKGKTYFKLLNSSYSLSDKENIDSTNKYIAEIIGKFRYIGILSEDLIKETLGLNVYPNGDIYFGQWKNDKKEGNGLYQYFTNKDITELYVGSWVNGCKKGNGVYYWIQSPISNGILNNISFDVAIGEFDSDEFIKGITFQQTIQENDEVNQQIYIGKFNNKRQKEDANGIMIQKNLIFIGEIKESQIVEGKMINFTENDPITIDNSYFYIKNEEQFETLKLTMEEQEPLITLKKKNNFIELFEKIEKYYISIHDLCAKYSDFDSFEKANNKEILDILQNYSILIN